jgi:signal transduction histidine kinase
MNRPADNVGAFMTRDELLALFPGDSEQAGRVREALAGIDRKHQIERDRLLGLFDEVPVHLGVVEGPELRCTMVNRRVREFSSTMVGKTVHEIYPGDNPLVAAVERVYATGEPETLQHLPPYFPDGSHAERFFTRSFAPLRDEHGDVYGVLTLVYEVTEDVRARVAHREAERRNQLELQRMSSLLEEAPAPICVLEGPELRVVMMNRLSREQFAGRDLRGVSLRDIVPPSNSTFLAACRVYETGVPETFEVVARDVEAFAGRSFSTTLAPIRDADGKLTRIMIAALEFTEQRRVQQALEAQARDLEAARRQAVEASRAKDEFLAMLGHELRNPLAPIVMTVESMRLEGPASPQVELLWRQVRHLVRLVDDLLDVSRIARGLVELQRNVVELSAIVNRALEMTSPLLDKRRQRIIADLAPATVNGDLDRLAQVVANLITNAAKYSEVGSQIRIRTECSGGMAKVTVADDGVGIAPEMLGQVFDVFVQQSQTLARSEGGLGLGLSIVKGLVEAHGGRVSASSDGVGKGSTFVIELPAIERPSAAVEVTRPQLRQPPPIPARRILVVDDNRDAALALGRALEALGQIVLVAHDGPSALREALAFQPHIGLLDIGLPGMDGYQVAAALRAAHDIRLFAVTGYTEPRDHQRSRDAGFEQHLVKPVTVEGLVALLQRPNPDRAAT